ncbi:MAG: DNA adenine methylase [Pseudomonas aeruginosa]|jgi:adenine-specific DNA-methyltransferase|uniref:DNA adenine methylase n=1 Tax=Pseudomonas TaxID=286 RepID=UPI000AAC7B75|nr:DNA adenine methylase [Pseudomonas aeruginosa]DAL63638.1 MAG TPA_asm: D12 class N6 adenine specific DNA methyltransferase [Bacteriophage sp.]MBG4636919.1 DNA adenine methylase [Pseudomonas aeruginosa]MBG4730406.1 DNA adenine methylase [Pseudomonas aeruginosa]MBH3751538.1 DNA adenine methylase [Pseudomonas aeruginosa]MBH8894794.1 DNA adenine methylase [Pseudomonas aeruginosa]
MTFRYIGSKSRLIDQITTYMGLPKQGAFFVDAFCGTGVVAEAAADLGWDVRINDSLHSAVISSGARLISADQAAFKKLGGYTQAIAKLNAAKPKHGFMWREYSPASVDTCGLERRYFTQENAARIDAMRAQIADWTGAGTIDEVEERLLIADLFGALNRVANIAGTFGCFLSKWTNQSQDTIAMRCRDLKKRGVRVEATVGDVFDVPNAAHDLVYLDPPYTKRQYASYYHILETVALGDEPEVKGVAGLRPWKNLASDFCYKTRALQTLSRLVQGLKAQKVLLSYSSEGHICMQDIKSELSKIGTSTMHPLGAIGRYRPNKVASSTASDVSEFLVVVERPAVQLLKAPPEAVKTIKPVLLENYA